LQWFCSEHSGRLIVREQLCDGAGFTPRPLLSKYPKLNCIDKLGFAEGGQQENRPGPHKNRCYCRVIIFAVKRDKKSSVRINNQ
jgi:hypothetical protein